MRKFLVALILLAVTAPLGAQPDVRPWFIGLDGGVYRPNVGGYARVGLGTAAALAIHDGIPYVIGNDNQVWSGPDGKWAPILAGLRGRRIAADRDGTLYVIGLDGGVYAARHGTVGRMGLAMGSDVAADGGNVYIVGTDGHVWTSTRGGDFSILNGIALARRVAAAGGKVYILGTDNGVYEIGRSAIKRLGLGLGQELAVDGAVPYVVGTDSYVWRYVNGNWSRYGAGQAKGIAVPR